uniref:Uncharacterized protein n=1 Tax=Arundo donax TaxID=35708 RepID=A0A0A9G373_ARUDO
MFKHYIKYESTTTNSFSHYSGEKVKIWTVCCGMKSSSTEGSPSTSLPPSLRFLSRCASPSNQVYTANCTLSKMQESACMSKPYVYTPFYFSCYSFCVA